MEDDEDIDEISEQQDGIMEIKETEMTDTTMTDKDQSTTCKQQQQQQETTISRNTISTTAGDFNHQFNMRTKSNETTNNSTPTGAKRQ
jgi:hypothetical protein